MAGVFFGFFAVFPGFHEAVYAKSVSVPLLRLVEESGVPAVPGNRSRCRAAANVAANVAGTGGVGPTRSVATPLPRGRRRPHDGE